MFLDMKRLAGQLLILGIAAALWQEGAAQSGDTSTGERVQDLR